MPVVVRLIVAACALGMVVALALGVFVVRGEAGVVDRSEFVDAKWLVRGRSIVFAFRHVEYREVWGGPLSSGTRADYTVDRLLIGVYDTRSKRTVVLLRKENPERGRGSLWRASTLG
jgi:hypothetical protein